MRPVDPFLWPFSLTYSAVMSARNLLYNSQVIPAIQTKSQVWSFGNLTMGGTGKTPLIDLFARELGAMKCSVGIVTRGYKGWVTAPHRVDPSKPNAIEQFGDESVWLAHRHPRAYVSVGKPKWKAAVHADEIFRPKIILLDDGLQHRRLARNQNFLLIDSTQGRQDYRVFPMGLGRERIRPALQRVSHLFFTKTNLVKPSDLERVQSLFESFLGETMFLNLELNYVTELATRQLRPIQTLKGLKAFLVSGIARPTTFESLLREKGVEVVGHQIFPDHHNYRNSDVEDIMSKKLKSKAQVMITTEKDALKIQGLNLELSDLFVTQLELGPRQEVSALVQRLLTPPAGT